MNIPEWATAIKERDGYACQECPATIDTVGSKRIHAHHIKPIKQGGKNTLVNGITLCSKCHRAKHPRKGKRAEPLKKITSKFGRVFLQRQSDWLQSGRIRRLLTTRQVANETGVPYRTVMRYMRGDIKRYDLDVVSRFCTYFQCRPSDIVERD